MSPAPHSLRDAALFHLAFFTVALPLAIQLQGAALGWTILALALLYNLALPLIGRWRGHPEWWRLWLFLLPLSCTQPLADWMLVSRMGTLVFPDHGLPRIGGAVPVYFMGLWIMPLWPLCLLAEAVRRPYATTAVLALLAFLIWEWAARPLQLWHAQNVRTVAGFALYPLIPEVLLTLAALWMYRQTRQASRLQKIAAAASVTVFYTGALALALLWIG